MPAKGDGITKRRDGRYMARYTIETPEGPKRKTIYGGSTRKSRRSLPKRVATRLGASSSTPITLNAWCDLLAKI